MNLRCSLTLEYGSEEEAIAVEKALDPDNEGFVQTEVNGWSLKAVISSDRPESLRHTLDDLLACVKVAEDAVGITRISESDGDEG
jgi:hypothetical protein